MLIENDKHLYIYLYRNNNNEKMVNVRKKWSIVGLKKSHLNNMTIQHDSQYNSSKC